MGLPGADCPLTVRDFHQVPYDSGYDVTLGTSDRGTNVHEVPSRSYSYKHMLIVFGGLQGLESALANDEKLTVDDPELLFDHYVNVLPRQGSRTIRTEEALLIAMAALQEKLQPEVADVETDLSDLLPQSEDTGISVRRDALVSKKQKKRKLVEEEIPETPVATETATSKPAPKIARQTANPFSDPSESSEKIAPADNDDFEVVSSSTVSGSKQHTVSNNDLSRFD